jgi:predicted dehydrogenase
VLRVGLVGCGRAAEYLYLPTIASAAGGQLVAVADPLEERRTLIAQSIGDGCKPYPDLTAMLAQGELDAVLIATPPKLHVPMTIESLEAGVAVLVEKPLAESRADAQRLLPYDNDQYPPVMIGYNRRNWKPMRLMKQRLSQMDIKPIADRITVDTVFDSDASGWQSITGHIDPLDDLACHHLDLLRYLFDCDIAWVSAKRLKEAEIVLEVGLSNGVKATCHHEQCDRTAEHLKINPPTGPALHALMGSNLIAPPDGGARKLLDTMDRIRRRFTGNKWTLGESYQIQFERFFDCVAKGTRPSPGIADGIAIIDAVEAARRSAELNGERMEIAKHG